MFDLKVRFVTAFSIILLRSLLDTMRSCNTWTMKTPSWLEEVAQEWSDIEKYPHKNIVVSKNFCFSQFSAFFDKIEFVSNVPFIRIWISFYKLHCSRPQSKTCQMPKNSDSWLIMCMCVEFNFINFCFFDLVEYIFFSFLLWSILSLLTELYLPTVSMFPCDFKILKEPRNYSQKFFIMSQHVLPIVTINFFGD